MYDWKCYELAVAFLEDEPALSTTLNGETNRRRLAAEIQETIENFIREKLAEQKGEKRGD